MSGVPVAPGKNNLLVSFINLNVITCNMKKKKIETK